MAGGYQRAAREMLEYAKECGAEAASLDMDGTPPKLVIVHAGKTTVVRLLASGGDCNLNRRLRGIIKKACQ